MKLLLDTHAFIWLVTAPEMIPPDTLETCKRRENRLLVSLVTLWEIQIKSQLGKMRLGSSSLPEIVSTLVEQGTIDLLPIMSEHIFGLEALPFHHRDPFDRLLVSQARAEKASLVSKDRTLSAYEVELLW